MTNQNNSLNENPFNQNAGTPTLNIALDLGNANAKIAIADSQRNVKTLVFPSNFILSDTLPSNINAQINPEIFIVDADNEDMEIAFGPFLENERGLIEADDLNQTYSTSKTRYEELPYQLLAKSIILKMVELTKTQEANVQLAISVPSSDLDRKQDIINGLQKVIVGVISGKTIEADIVSLEVLEQARGIYYDLALIQNANEKPTPSKEVLEENVIIIDFGGGTTQFDVFFNGRRTESKSKTFNLGIKNIFEDIIKTYPDLTVSDVENSLKNKKDIQIGSIDISYEQIKAEFDKKKRKLLDIKTIPTIKNIMNNNKRCEIRIAGGGAILFEEIKEKFPNNKVEIVENPQSACARGMLKNLMRKG